MSPLLLLLFAVAANAQSRVVRSAAISNLSEETSNILGELISAVNPLYLIGLGLFVVAGCAVQLTYGSRSSSGKSTHVASRNAPYPLRA